MPFRAAHTHHIGEYPPGFIIDSYKEDRQPSILLMGPSLESAIDQFRYIKIQAITIDLSTRLWGINPTNSVFIP